MEKIKQSNGYVVICSTSKERDLALAAGVADELGKVISKRAADHVILEIKRKKREVKEAQKHPRRPMVTRLKTLLRENGQLLPKSRTRTRHGV